MTQRTDLEPHFVGTFHVTDDLAVYVDGYRRETVRFLAMAPSGGVRGIPYGPGFLIDSEAPLPEDD